MSTAKPPASPKYFVMIRGVAESAQERFLVSPHQSDRFPSEMLERAFSSAS